MQLECKEKKPVLEKGDMEKGSYASCDRLGLGWTSDRWPPSAGLPDSVGHVNDLKGFDILEFVAGEIDQQLLGPALAGLDPKLNTRALLGLHRWHTGGEGETEKGLVRFLAWVGWGTWLGQPT